MTGRHQPRPTRSTGTRTINRWRLKTYEITLDGQDIAANIVAAAHHTLVESIPIGDDGVGFVIIHQGVQQVWLLADLWTGDIVSQHTFFADLDDPTAFQRVSAGGPTACVWELAVHAHERNAYVVHVLDPADGSHLDAYLADVRRDFASQVPRRPMTPSTHHSERLLLRPFHGDDFDAMAEFFADPISKFYGGPCDRDDAWRKFAAYPGHWALRGYGPWALERKDTGDFIGLCGPWYPEGWIEREITWALVAGHHGHGFATEAAELALSLAYEQHGWTTAVSVVAVDNTPSAKVARRIGASVERQVEGRYGLADVYRHRPPPTP